MSIHAKVPTPDFAFPEKVTRQAEANLKTALKHGDGQATVEALVQIGIAQGAIDSNDLPQVINRVEQIRSTETDSVTRAILSLVEAKMYQAVYEDDRWTYNERQLPLEPLPTDIREWSGDQYKAKIRSLCLDAVSPVDALAAQKVTAWPKVVVADAQTAIYYPTLYDFTANAVIQILTSQVDDSYPLGDSWLAAANAFVKLSTAYLPQTLGDIATIYQSLSRLHCDNTSALAQVDCNRVDWVLSLQNEDDESQAYEAFFKRYWPEEASGLFLAKMCDVYRYQAPPATMLPQLRSYTNRFPDNLNSDAFRTLAQRICDPEVRVSTPEVVALDKEFRVSIEGRNASRVKLSLYKVKPTRNGQWRVSNAAKAKLVLTKELTLSDETEAPFYVDTTLVLRVEEYGNYALVPEVKGTPKPTSVYTFACSNLSLSTLGTASGCAALVVDTYTGQPVNKAEILGFDTYKMIAKDPFGATDAEGWLQLSENKDIRSVVARLGDDNVSPAVYKPNGNLPNARTSAQVVTDLPLYRLGDSMRATAIAYRRAPEGNSPLVGVTLKFTLRDPNYQEVDTLTAVTDNFGRATVDFNLPENGLTGNFVIEVSHLSKHMCTSYVMVSDYKLPTFEVVAEKPVLSDRGVTLKAKAITYAGMPLAGAEVKVAMYNDRRWRWWFSNNSTSIYSTQSITDDTGNVEISFPNDLLEQAPYPTGNFEVTVIATSPSGETRQATTRFCRFQGYRVGGSLPANLDASIQWSPKFTIEDGLGNPVDMPLTVTFTAANGEFEEILPIGEKISLESIPSGEYEVKVALADTTLECEPMLRELFVYRPSDKLSPSSRLLWLSTNEITADAQGNVKLLYATTSQSPVCVVLSSDSKIVEHKWLYDGPGMHKLSLSLPENTGRWQLRLLTVSENNRQEATVDISTDQSNNQLQLKFEILRDRVQPGDNETLTVKVTDSLGTVTPSAIILDIYNKALTQLSSQSLAFKVSPLLCPWMHIDCNTGGNKSNSVNVTRDWVSFQWAAYPQLQMYDFNFVSYGHVYEEYDSSPILFRSNKMSMPMMMKRAANDGAVVTAESAEEEMSTDAGAVEESSQQVENKEFAFRDAETPLAWYAPALVTGEDGSLEVTYRVPNANATWVIAALAYNSQMLTATAEAEQLASKPVMVTPNMPRFLRQGDQIVLQAQVFNATEAAANVATTFEIYDPVSGKTLACQSFTDEIAAQGSAVVKMQFDTPFDVAIVGYRVKSTLANWADGEQGVIPVLESVQPVVESQPFYMAPSQATETLEVPAAPSDGGRTTLQFTENPAWTIVTALPGLLQDAPTTSNGAAASLFSAATADGLLRQYPEIKSTLHRWTTSDQSDSTLTSMLERDQSLKIALLQSTPWVKAAASDTERMQRLALLMNKREIERTITAAVDLLSKTQCHGGGWSWTTSYNEPSPWTTMNVLGIFGQLKKMGYLPPDKRLNDMITNALAYIDRYAVDQHKRYPKVPQILYVSMRSLWNDVKQSTAAANAQRATVQMVIADWHDYSTVDKAIAASILEANSYHATAQRILESLREYAKTSDTRGEWWPSLANLTWDSRYTSLAASALMLRAFADVEPSCADIDRIRQWIIIERQAQMWKPAVVTNELIYGMLSTGTKWTVPAQGAIVKFNGQELETPACDKALGQFEMALPVEGGQLVVGRTPGVPSYGGVIRQGRMEISEIKAVAIDDLSIEKTLYRMVTTSTGVQWERVDTFAVGDRVKVDLLIKNQRDMDYVTIVDQRGACLEPVEQLPQPLYSQGACFYRENRDAVTNLFIQRLPRGVYHLSYEMNVSQAGRFSAGIATIQSQLTPLLTAHSSGAILKVK
ncbi:MAG: MG2 domain-containing protein [Bacteroidales bacterium]|nr:hypothetical protein [Bacteroidales bacterium]MCD8394123.1 MG2 domain-containing protein [Bacteroidales bacterium]